MKSLLALAEARQTSVSQDSLKLYVSRLAQRGEEDLKAVFAELAEQSRGDYESAFPTLGDLVERVDKREKAKAEADAAERRRMCEMQWRREWAEDNCADFGMTVEEMLECMRRNKPMKRLAIAGAPIVQAKRA